MNVDTGEVVRILAGQDPCQLVDQGFTPVPPVPELEAQAEAVTRKTGRGRVDLRERSPLSDWAAQQRRRKKNLKVQNRKRRKAIRHHHQHLRRRKR